MRETRADTAQALLYALALHVLLFALVFLGMWWTRASAPLSAAGPVIEAELVDPNALSARDAARAARPAPAQPSRRRNRSRSRKPRRRRSRPEPVPQDAPVPQQQQAQERVPEPDTREQEARRPRRDRAGNPRTRAGSKAPPGTDRPDRAPAPAGSRAEAAPGAAAARRQQLAEDPAPSAHRLARQADAGRSRSSSSSPMRRRAMPPKPRRRPTPSASPPPGNERRRRRTCWRATQAALQEAILRNWTRPDTVPLGQRCRHQHPPDSRRRGDRRRRSRPSCPYDELGRRSVEAAVLKAQPLPYAGFEAVFSRNLNLNFEAQDR